MTGNISIQRKLISFILILTAVTAAAQDDYRLRSFLSSYTNAIPQLTDTAEFCDLVFTNPAAAGLSQKNLVGINISILARNEQTFGLAGGIYSLSAVLPTYAGSFYGSTFFAHDTVPYNYGNIWGINLGWSRLYDRSISFGIGVGCYIADNYNWSVASSIGLIGFAGENKSSPDLTWFAAVDDLGWGTLYTQTNHSYPRPFTLNGGISMPLIKSSVFSLDFNANMIVPQFSNVILTPGFQMTLFGSVSLDVSSTANLVELINSNFISLIPSFSVRYKLQLRVRESEKPVFAWDPSRFSFASSMAFLDNASAAVTLGITGEFGNTDTTGPVLNVESDTVYMSANNDGLMDSVTYSWTINDSNPLKKVVFKIMNEEGTTVVERTYVENIDSLLDKSFKTGILREFPLSFFWDGMTDFGQTAPDGTYSFSLVVTDMSGNATDSGTVDVLLDTVSPSISFPEGNLQNFIFSPNNDGFKDTLTIPQEGDEAEWQGIIRDSRGKVVQTYAWNGKPGPLVWDGADNNGNLAADGLYSYEITGTDTAGNFSLGSIPSIRVHKEIMTVGIEISETWISPNQDKNHDEIIFFLAIPLPEEVTGWRIDVIGAAGGTVDTLTDDAFVPQEIRYGCRKNGTPLPDGKYTARLTTDYRNGNVAEAESAEFIIDTTAPYALIKADKNEFTPNGDGKNDTLILYQETSVESLWTGVIYDSDGFEIESFKWQGTAEPALVWKGQSNSGIPLQDGFYSYQLFSTDNAGNRGISNVVNFAINTKESDFIVRLSDEYFSPNNDGVKDFMIFYIDSKRRNDVRQYTLGITDPAGQNIKTFSGTGIVIDSIEWKGRDNTGIAVPDGQYNASLKIEFLNNEKLTIHTQPFFIDTTPPRISITTPYQLFSPNGDNEKDTIPVSFQTSKENNWVGRIFNAESLPVRDFAWKSDSYNYTWDGIDQDGKQVPDGKYILIAECTDPAGNYSRGVLNPIVVDTRGSIGIVQVNQQRFSPNGDGKNDNAEFSFDISNKENIQSWNFTVSSSDSSSTKKFSGENVLPKLIIWDGRNDGGIVREGEYTAVMSIKYLKGDTLEIQSPPVVIDVTPPRALITVEPSPFSPDSDGIKDTILLTITADDVSPAGNGAAVITDSSGAAVFQFPPINSWNIKLSWDGVYTNKQRVSGASKYLYKITLVDSVGNQSIFSGDFYTDVLVYRSAKVLVIDCGGFTFTDAGALPTPQSTEGIRNSYVIQRIVQFYQDRKTIPILINGKNFYLAVALPAAMIPTTPIASAYADKIIALLSESGMKPGEIIILSKQAYDLAFSGLQGR